MKRSRGYVQKSTKKFGKYFIYNKKVYKYHAENETYIWGKNWKMEFVKIKHSEKVWLPKPEDNDVLKIYDYIFYKKEQMVDVVNNDISLMKYWECEEYLNVIDALLLRYY